ncbi:MAG: class I SAM-dependent methyltransferase, partial [Patescibacteria group bacterium]|nr:class I SAM-dependent methyltransferase [Patescibacteria group bacterium]
MTKKDQESFTSDFVFGPTWYPGEAVVKFSARYLKRRTGIKTWQKKRNVKRVLDAGCGNGRHVIFFSEQGFDVYGIDISNDAIKIAKEW